jgi:geranylgeranyl reductase family protein
MDFEVIIIGAGPAGSAAAIELSRQGRRVLLLERNRMPQHKTCGDGLLPDALRALDQLGVGGRARAEGHLLNALTISAPGGRMVRLEVPALTLPRPQLHGLLHDQARKWGTEMLQGEALGPRVEGGQVVGVEVEGPDRSRFEVRSPVVILATGARSGVLKDFGICLQEKPSAVAIRGYFRDLSGEFADSLYVSYDRSLFPGFGWVFPLPGGIFNIGCGRFLRGETFGQKDLRRMLDYFIRNFPPARAIAQCDDMDGTPCGGLLRTGLTGARSYGPGLLVAGEALGAACPFTGEGVGKALETGIHAALFAGEALKAGDFSTSFLAGYHRFLQDTYGRLYGGYLRAERWLSRPRLLNLLAWQLDRKPAARKAVERILAEGLDPRRIFSLRSLFGSLSGESQKPGTVAVPQDN